VPLPSGWTARIVRAWVDYEHAPPLQWAEVQFVGPDGASFSVKGSASVYDLVGLTPQQVITRVWPDYAAYVLATIADITSLIQPVVPPPTDIPVDIP
jgi:hypothetical protein